MKKAQLSRRDLFLRYLHIERVKPSKQEYLNWPRIKKKAFKKRMRCFWRGRKYGYSSFYPEIFTVISPKGIHNILETFLPKRQRPRRSELDSTMKFRRFIS